MKIVMVSLAFAPARVIIECLKQAYKTIGNIKFEHYVLAQHYPVDKDRNDLLIKTVCDSYGCKYFDLGKNTGLSAGYNYLLKEANLQDDDIVIGLDLDCWPISQGWGEALVKVLSDRSQNTGWASLINPTSDSELQARGHTLTTLGGVMCMVTHSAVLNSICAWTGKMLKDLGGIKELNQWYGGFEAMSYPLIKSLGYSWAFLPEFKEEYNDKVGPDPCYRSYKRNYAHLGTTKLDFESWLNEAPERLDIK